MDGAGLHVITFYDSIVRILDKKANIYILNIKFLFVLFSSSWPTFRFLWPNLSTWD